MAKPKFFRVAVEGVTATDGRVIERHWIEEIVAGYNRATYGARVNMEHISGFSPEPPFNAYGDVLAVRAEPVEIELDGKKEKRLALFAEIDPTPELVALTKKRQKIYTSIEISPNFAGTGKVGLIGLAVTDTPASLGTEILAFSAKAGNEPVKALLDARKQHKDNLFSAALETDMVFADEATGDSALDKVLAGFARLLEGKTADKTDPEPARKETANPGAGADPALLTAFSDLSKALVADRKAAAADAETRFNRLTSELAALKVDIETTRKPGGGGASGFTQGGRPPVTGGDGRVRADC